MASFKSLKFYLGISLLAFLVYGCSAAKQADSDSSTELKYFSAIQIGTNPTVNFQYLDENINNLGFYTNSYIDYMNTGFPAIPDADTIKKTVNLVEISSPTQSVAIDHIDGSGNPYLQGTQVQATLNISDADLGLTSTGNIEVKLNFFI